MPSFFESLLGSAGRQGGGFPRIGAIGSQPQRQGQTSSISGPTGATANPAFSSPLAVGGPAAYSPEQEAQQQISNPFLQNDVRTQRTGTVVGQGVGSPAVQSQQPRRFRGPLMGHQMGVRGQAPTPYYGQQRLGAPSVQGGVRAGNPQGGGVTGQVAGGVPSQPAISLPGNLSGGQPLATVGGSAGPAGPGLTPQQQEDAHYARRNAPQGDVQIASGKPQPQYGLGALTPEGGFQSSNLPMSQNPVLNMQQQGIQNPFSGGGVAQQGRPRIPGLRGQNLFADAPKPPRIAGLQGQNLFSQRPVGGLAPRPGQQRPQPQPQAPSPIGGNFRQQRAAARLSNDGTGGV
jgi:hypothetical protein